MSAENIKIEGVPDYSWYAGCFGSATGNLMGFWDRSGLPNVYTGPTANGIAPLNSIGSNAGIRSLWASKAGFDGRPEDKPGHIDDYWDYYLDEVRYSYESTSQDPYLAAGRDEHEPDSIGDFIGASQNKWKNMNGECNGNIDAFAFNFWDKSGLARTNYVPPLQQDGIEVRDLQSGLRKFAEFRGYNAEVYSQLTDFNPETPEGMGFTFDDLKREINAGFPVMLFLQEPGAFSRDIFGMPEANPRVHGMVAYGYVETDGGEKAVRYRTSWADGDFVFSVWDWINFQAGLNLRGVIVFHPIPQITSITKVEEKVTLRWEGAASVLMDEMSGDTFPASWYVVEQSPTLTNPQFTGISEPTTNHMIEVDACCEKEAYYRIRQLSRQEAIAMGAN